MVGSDEEQKAEIAIEPQLTNTSCANEYDGIEIENLMHSSNECDRRGRGERGEGELKGGGTGRGGGGGAAEAEGGGGHKYDERPNDREEGDVGEEGKLLSLCGPTEVRSKLILIPSLNMNWA